MEPGHFKAGVLYPSRSEVRAAYGEYWKGILVRGEQVALIQAYRGLARRVHYADELDPLSMTLNYVGEGLNGDQLPTRANQALCAAAHTGKPVEVFFDCGDIRLPVGDRKPEKHLLAGGRWLVMKAEYVWLASEKRRVWHFRLTPENEETRQTLQAIFLGRTVRFEAVAPRAPARRCASPSPGGTGR